MHECPICQAPCTCLGLVLICDHCTVGVDPARPGDDITVVSIYGVDVMLRNASELTPEQFAEAVTEQSNGRLIGWFTEDGTIGVAVVQDEVQLKPKGLAT